MTAQNRESDRRVEIVIAEDSPTQAQQLSYLLEESGFQVIAGKNGKEALNAAQRRRPSLIISDIVMPEMDGYTLCKKVKSDEKLRDTPVILLTSLSSPLDIIRGLESGADNFIPKPYEKDDLLSRIRHVLANAELRKGQKVQLGLEIIFSNEKYLITSDRQQILDLLLSTYETAVRKNLDLMQSQDELNQLNEQLEQKVRERTAQLAAQISERKRAEEEISKLNAELEQRVIQRTSELQEITAFLNNILESSTEYSIIAADLDGTVLTWNEGARRNYGYSAEDMVGKMKLQVLHAPENMNASEIKGFLETAFKLGQAEGEFNQVRRNGKLFPASASVTLRRDVNGSVIGYLLISKDITHQKNLEEQLRKKNDELKERAVRLELANKELESFSYSVSHDLRAPLRSIDGFSEALAEDYQDKLDDNAKDYLHTIRAATQRMGQLIDDLLNLSRVARSELKADQVDLSTLVSEVATELQKSEPERQVDLMIDSGITAKGDRHLLRVVIENLVGNAWKFTAKRPLAKIEFGMSGDNGMRTYFVRDNGAGFDMIYANKLFGAFQRLHTAEEFHGTGIGLATVQRIIHRHNGRVWADAKPEEGATFYFTLGS